MDLCKILFKASSRSKGEIGKKKGTGMRRGRIEKHEEKDREREQSGIGRRREARNQSEANQVKEAKYACTRAKERRGKGGRGAQPEREGRRE